MSSLTVVGWGQVKLPSGASFRKRFPPSGLYTAAFSFVLSQPFLCVCKETELSGISSSAYKDTSLIRLGTHSYNLIELVTSPKSLSPLSIILEIKVSTYVFLEGHSSVCNVHLVDKNVSKVGQSHSY